MLYKTAGVDIDTLNKVKSRIKQMVKKTYTPQVLSDIGLFGSLYQLKNYTNPVLVSSCDSVGTKLLVAKMMKKHNTVGEDIVNHCVNDILTLGAKPLFFLDYISYSNLKPQILEEIFKGLVKGCQENDCSLVGGETAQLPGFYKAGAYDMVGFIVGVVEKAQIIDGSEIESGDIILGLPSSGLHTNGYSLARRVLFEKKRFKPRDKIKGLSKSLGEELLRVHRSYFHLLYPNLNLINGLAHITGGGFYDNIQRLLRKNISCMIYKNSWKVPKIFEIIQGYGKIPEREMYRVFNMGIGMVLFVAPESVAKIQKKIKEAIIIGEVVSGNFGVRIIEGKKSSI